MKKILWLTSWYPNKTDRYTGDFIQRHARAVALYDQIIVLHVVKAEKPFFLESTFEEMIVEGNLTEHIVYFYVGNKWAIWNKFLSFIKYMKLSKSLVIKYLHEKEPFSAAHVHVPIKAGLTALWLKKKYKIDYFLTEHYDIYNNIVTNPFAKRSWLFRFFTKKIIKKANFFLPVSNQLGETIRTQVFDKSYRVVLNAVDCSLFYYTQRRNACFRFIHVSGMRETKNVEGIIRSFAKLVLQNSEVELLLVGSSNKQIDEMAKETELVGKNIFFTGEVSYAMVAEHMQSSSALVLFSRTENMPCVILEALCCGLPVITTSVGGIPEVVNETNGSLVQSEDETALQQSFVDMLTNYEKYNRASIAEEAKKRFSYEVIGKQIDNLYQTCLD
ncbi:MAG: glycosyltransferase [Bacteroidetes bacterium]|nr:glycosyltransferase [Bacteroidota bacterium]